MFEFVRSILVLHTKVNYFFHGGLTMTAWTCSVMVNAMTNLGRMRDADAPLDSVMLGLEENKWVMS